MTVIEIACTISILGIMMFFALKGTATIESMRAIAVAYELQQYQRLIATYQADYRALPGDDGEGAVRWRRPAALTALPNGLRVLQANDGKIDGELYESANPGGEQFTAWRDLRFAGMIDGDPKLEGLSALPENPFNGFYGLDKGNLGQKGGSLCATRVPGRAAEIIDKKIDDGRINAGEVVATSKFSIEQNNHFEAPDTAPYNIEKEYIICVPLLP